MDWRRHPTDDPNDPEGVDALLRRVQDEVGGPPLSGTVFLQDAGEMLRSTREIEAVARGAAGTLYVGFQVAEKLDRERNVYGDLVERGTRVVAFGVGAQHAQGNAGDEGKRWKGFVSDDPRLVGALVTHLRERSGA